MAEETNGTAPAPPAPPEQAGTPVSERLMGLFGIAVAVGIALVGFDLLTGGVLSRAVAQAREGGEGDG